MVRSCFCSCFDGFFVETGFQIGDGSAHALWCGAAGNSFRIERRIHAETFHQIGFQCGRDFLERIDGQRRPGNLLFFRLAQDLTNEVVRLAERNALAHEIVRGFRREQSGIGRRGPQPLGVELCELERSGRDRDHVPNLVVRGEKRFLVFLQVALIARGQTFQRRQQAEQRAGDAAGFAANQFPGVRVLFLWQQAAAGGLFVGKSHVCEFLRRKEDKIFGEAG